MSYRSLIVLSVSLVVVACGGEDPPAGPAETPPAPCPSGRGPAMVRIPMSEGRSACIDATEVTREQYAAFLADSNAHGAGSRLESCGIAPYKDEPDAACLAEPVVCKGDCARHPQVCVSHCNAQAFCKWAGKRLGCGSIAARKNRRAFEGIREFPAEARRHSGDGPLPAEGAQDDRRRNLAHRPPTVVRALSHPRERGRR